MEVWGTVPGLPLNPALNLTGGRGAFAVSVQTNERLFEALRRKTITHISC